MMSARRHSTWWNPAEVPPDAAVGEQLRLIDRLLSGEITAAEFEGAFLKARTREIRADERPDGCLEAGLSQIFLAVDRYVSDPELREPPDDLDDDGLIEYVRRQRQVIYGEREPDW